MFNHRIEAILQHNSKYLEAFASVPRNKFLPSYLSDDAVLDKALPIGCGQTISQPSIVAHMIKALNPNKGQSILEVGSGSGYLTAILSRLVRRVYAVEYYKELLDLAEKTWVELNCFGITSLRGNGYQGWEHHAPFDGIICSAMSDHIPPLWLAQLKINGSIIMPLLFDDCQYLVKVIKSSSGDYSVNKIITTSFGPLHSS